MLLRKYLKGLRNFNGKIIFLFVTKIADMLIYVVKPQISSKLLRFGLIKFHRTSAAYHCYSKTQNYMENIPTQEYAELFELRKKSNNIENFLPEVGKHGTENV